MPALVSRISRSSGDLHGVGQVLLAPVYAILDPLVTGQRELGVLPEREPLGDFLLKQVFRVRQHCCVLVERCCLRVGRISPTVDVGAGDREPDGLGGVRRDGHVVAELSALALAESGVVAAAGASARWDRGAGQMTGGFPAAPVVRPGLAPCRGEAGANDRRPVVG